MQEAATSVEDPLILDKVFVQQWPSEWSVVGPPKMIKDLEEVADGLADSSFMHYWIVSQIRQALLDGHVFNNVGRITEAWRGREDGVKTSYRIARRSEVLDVAEHVQFANVTGHQISRRAQAKSYVLHYLDSDSTRSMYEDLPGQAKAILDILNDSGRDQLSEAAIEVLVVQGADQLKSKQPPDRVWGFYRSRLVKEGHLEEMGEDE